MNEWVWKNADIISTRGIPREAYETIFRDARRCESGSVTPSCRGKILATLFFEPSTRTQFSFQSAMLRLGGNYLGFSGTSGTSVTKGETLHDTMKVIDACADAIVLRHPQDGAAEYAARVANKPLINAGDGGNQHPSQAMVDLYTVWKERKHIDGLTFLFVGDLKYGRTVHSLAFALANFDVTILLSSPPALRMPASMINELRDRITIREVEGMPLGDADVVYATRVQRERLPDPQEHAKYAYRLGNEALRKMRPDALLMHPFPRVNEIAPEVDADPRAAYFRQEANGIPVRMALLDNIIGESI